MGAVSLTTGKLKLFDESYLELPKAIYASAAYPLAFLPIELEGQWWLDGGLKEVAPLKSAIDLGANEIDVILCSPKENNDGFAS